MEDPDVSHVLFLLFFFINGQGKGGIVFLYEWSGEGGMEDPEVSQVIFLLFFFINGKGKVGEGILQK